ncbi:hypothetical protein SLH46_14905 [Draconibacterium sp. IB214405]|uniref:hypothetical protein n=1 Tax=Draconibacterium sp. IB214405 TaxID=3097352 RepID=UPI002A145114|nr:hypothetical protein [Draconibacterium sp. IB214405]MDX8340489.1 hypothetical protein [Draconibacterium sp. IB214405]
MKLLSKLIHKSYMTFLPTHYPVHFYGLPDGKVYLCFARFYEMGFGKTDMEFVFARHNDFGYNYENEVLVPCTEFRAPVYNEMVDNPDPDITILEVRRDIETYPKAVEYISDLYKSNLLATSTLHKVGREREDVQLGV